MKIIEPGFEILKPDDADGGRAILRNIEAAGRTCYKSEDLITTDSSYKFVKNLIERHHEAILEHSFVTIKWICDRGVSHELVRHRVASFAQESTRYCNYSKEKFGEEITFIRPFFFDLGSMEMLRWESAMKFAEDSYFDLINNYHRAPQEARSVLPNSLKTEVVMTANLREWRHFFALRACRATGPAHPQMEEITRPCLIQLASMIPIVFDDILDGQDWCSPNKEGGYNAN